MQAEFQPHSWLSALAAPRETVVQQLWRQDELGVYLVMVHSTDHPDVPEVQHPWWHWFAPVRAQVTSPAAGDNTLQHLTCLIWNLMLPLRGAVHLRPCHKTCWAPCWGTGGPWLAWLTHCVHWL